MKPEKGYGFNKSVNKGFVVETENKNVAINSKEKVALIRKGNELFNKGELETAKRIFITLKYSDGLIRLGNHYLDEKNYTEAMRMFYAAPDRNKIDELSERFSKVIRKWLKDEVNDVI